MRRLWDYDRHFFQRRERFVHIIICGKELVERERLKVQEIVIDGTKFLKGPFLPGKGLRPRLKV